MDLAQLEAFQEVVRAGSLRRAAKALFLSHPALSDRIKRLEAEVGQGLFEREGNHMRLSQAGRALLPYVSRTMELQRQGREALSAITPVSQEVLVVGATDTTATYFLPNVLARFHQQESTDIQVTCGRTVHILTMVLRQDAHLGIMRLTAARATALFHPEAEPVRLFSEKVVLVAHPTHPLASRGRAGIKEVVRQPLVLYKGAVFYSLIEQVCRELAVPPQVRMRLDSVEMAKRMVSRNLGISFVPMSAARAEIAAGSLVHIPLVEDCEVLVDTVAITKRGLSVSPAACSLLNTLLEEAAPLDAA